MITDIPGQKQIKAEHLVLDFNGTLAIDGRLIEGVKPLLDSLSGQLSIHILTADTFGTAKDEVVGIQCTLEVLNPTGQDKQKEAYILGLGSNHVIAIGNGQNDALMLKMAALGIVVIQGEGASVKSLINADIVCHHISDALKLLLNPQRIVATLRT